MGLSTPASNAEPNLVKVYLPCLIILVDYAESVKGLFAFLLTKTMLCMVTQPCYGQIFYSFGFVLTILLHEPVMQTFLVLYCLTACLYAKCCNLQLIGWILELGPFIHFRIDGPDRLYGFRSKLKHRLFGKMVAKLSTEVVKC